MARPRVTARKYMGDDHASWAVFLDGRPRWTGLTQSEVPYYKAETAKRAGVTLPKPPSPWMARARADAARLAKGRATLTPPVGRWDPKRKVTRKTYAKIVASARTYYRGQGVAASFRTSYLKHVGRNVGSFKRRKGSWKKGAGGRFVGTA